MARLDAIRHGDEAAFAALPCLLHAMDLLFTSSTKEPVAVD
ncbi:MAG: hypothetical protein U0270_21145 [Labilithrix sp.]